MKKGQLTINTIITAALAVAVLVILFAIFTGKIKILPEQTTKTEQQVREATCGAQDGFCVSAEDKCQEGYKSRSAPPGGWLDCAKDAFCCRKAAE